MKTIIGGRQSGKTTKLIEMAAETGATIVTANSRMADYIKVMACEMGKDIKDPICINKIINTNVTANSHMTDYIKVLAHKMGKDIKDPMVTEHLLIDEAQMTLAQILKDYYIDAITVNKEDNE